MAKVGVGYDPSGRAKCKGNCGQKIQKGSVRISLTKSLGGQGGWRGRGRGGGRGGYGSRTAKENYCLANFSGVNTLKTEDVNLVSSYLQGTTDGTKASSSNSSSSSSWRTPPAPRSGLSSSSSAGRNAAGKNSTSVMRPEDISGAAGLLVSRGIPKTFVDKLMPFQKQGVAFALNCNGRVMLSDEMGLGKTVQAIAICAAYRIEWPCLIITPSSVKLNWADEFERWLLLEPGSINVVQSKSCAGNLDAQITIVSYGIFGNSSLSAELIRKKKFKVVILDESHYIKSRTAVRTKQIIPIVRASKRCGTPALARPVELFTQASSVRPKLLPSFYNYANRFCDARRMPWGMDYSGSSNLDELHSILRQFMVRRLKKTVLSQLPSKRRQRIPLQMPTRTNEIKELNQAMKELKEIDITSAVNSWENMSSQENSNLNASFANDLSSQVREQRNQQRALLSQIFSLSGRAKLPSVLEYLSELLNSTDKFLVFGHHHDVLDGIEQLMVRLKVKFIRIDGTVPSQERHDMVKAYQAEGSSYRVAILGLTSAGQGLTLTAASTVVFAELHWTPGVLSQAEDRCHRIGQKNAVNILYLLGKGTIDDVVWPMIKRKIETVSTALDGAKSTLQAETVHMSAKKNEPATVMNNSESNECESDNKEPQYAFGDVRSLFHKKPLVNVTTPPSGAPGKRTRSRIDDLPSHTDPVKRSRTEKGCVLCGESFDENGDKIMVECNECHNPTHLECGKLEICNDHPDGCLLHTPSGRHHYDQYVCDACEARRSAALTRDVLDLCDSDSRESMSIPKHNDYQDNEPLELLDLCEDSNNPVIIETWKCATCSHGNNLENRRCKKCGLAKTASTKKDNGTSTPGGFKNADIIRNWKCATCSHENNREDRRCKKCGLSKTASAKKENDVGMPGGFVNESWGCSRCTFLNPITRSSCEICGLKHSKGAETPKLSLSKNIKGFDDVNENIEDFDDDENKKTNEEDKSHASIDSFFIKVSLETGRLFFYDNDKTFLNACAHPEEVLNDDWRDVPDTITGKSANKKQIVLFVKRWKALRAIERQKLSGKLLRTNLSDAVLSFRRNSTPSTGSTQRYLATVGEKQVKHDVLATAVNCTPSSQSKAVAVGEENILDDVAKCLQCSMDLDPSHIKHKIRFCKLKCRNEYIIKLNSSAIRRQIFALERGVCQNCQFDCHEFYSKMKNVTGPERMQLLLNTKYKKNKKLLENPTEGDFWQADHILAVKEGGGLCSLSNIQTLCSPCHDKKTAEMMRRLKTTEKGSKDIRTFFK